VRIAGNTSVDSLKDKNHEFWFKVSKDETHGGGGRNEEH
jgi:hypothetical protein